ncbi:MAG: PAS domain S-box protein [Gammaproteobacteria bacterium]|nr:PAS domain S-box protein [Gammaproteobacteria bacterium]
MSLSRTLWRVQPSGWLWFWLAVAGGMPLLPLVIISLSTELRHAVYALPDWLLLFGVLALFTPLLLILGYLSRRQRGLWGHARALAGLIDQAADIILVCRIDGLLVEANSRALELLGLSRQELLGSSLWDLDLDCRLRHDSELQRGLLRGETVSFQTRFRTATGELAVEPHVCLGEWQGERHYLMLVRDITARSQSEAQLRGFAQELERARNLLEARVDERTRELSESFSALTRQTRDRLKAEQDLTRTRLLLNNIVESMPSALITMDLQGHVTQWNRQAEAYSGISRDEALGRTLEALLPQFAATIANVRQALRGSRYQVTERIASRLDEQMRVFDLAVFPLIAEQGRGIVLRVDDVTERVRMEEMLVQSEKILSLGGLAAGMAHEINNPLGGILQSAQNILRRLDLSRERNRQLAEDAGLDGTSLDRYLDVQRIRHFLEGIQESGQRAAAIVADTLSFARGASSDAVLIDPAEALESAIRLAGNFNPRSRFEFRRIEIRREYEAVGRVRAQKTKLEQVYLNLLVNAAHALATLAEGAEPHIVLRLSREGEWVRIDVIDNGPGMDEAVRRRVFEPFFTTKAEGAGTGLGLSVSFFIVTEQLQGTIAVESQPGHGAHFIIRLPQVCEEAASIPSQEEQIQLPLEV